MQVVHAISPVSEPHFFEFHFTENDDPRVEQSVGRSLWCDLQPILPPKTILPAHLQPTGHG